jgi:hypothetical protein
MMSLVPQENGRTPAQVLSVCPSHQCIDELQFVICIEPIAGECINYLIDRRSAVLLAGGLYNYLKPFHCSGSDGTPSADAANPIS